MNWIESRNVRRSCAIAFALIFSSGAAQAAGVELVIDFSGPSTTGGATYANAGDAEPTSCTITNGTDVWTCNDDVFVPWNTVWSGSTVTQISPEIEKGPGCFLSIVGFNSTYNAGGQAECNEASPGLGSYTLTSIPIPDVPLSTPIGLSLLGVTAAGYLWRRVSQ